MAASVTVRPAVVADAENISRLIHSQLHHRMPEPTGPAPDSFLQRFSPPFLEGCIGGVSHRYLVALAEDRLVGVLGVRENRHLLHLFVAELFQRQGIARRLWDRARSDVLAVEAEVEMTVRSSVYAVPVYRRFGFEVSGPRVDAEGVSWVPMRQVIRRGQGSLQ